MKDTFNIVPTIAWQVDQFGHSAVNAKLLADMGFAALFFSREDQVEKEKRRLNKEMEFIWEPMFLESNGSALFTHIMFDSYMPPDAINMD